MEVCVIFFVLSKIKGQKILEEDLSRLFFHISSLKTKNLRLPRQSNQILLGVEKIFGPRQYKLFSCEKLSQFFSSDYVNLDIKSDQNFETFSATLSLRSLNMQPNLVAALSKQLHRFFPYFSNFNLQMEGRPVIVGDPIILNHCKTNQNLACMAQYQRR